MVVHFFTRGQTQILNVTTLGALGDEQVIDGIGDDTSKRYIHHYNFPGYPLVKLVQCVAQVVVKSVMVRLQNVH